MSSSASMNRKRSFLLPSVKRISLYFGKEARGVDIFAIAVAGAFLSILVSGYVHFETNHIYHLPLVGKLYDLPQFGADGYIQSERWFASGIWLLLAGCSSFVNVGALFFALLVISRLLTFLAIFHVSIWLGYRKISFFATLAIILCFTDFLRFFAIGGGGLFFEAFTHSEVANGTLLFAISYAFRKRFGKSIAFIGATFFINAFMAVWVAVPVLLMFGRAWRRREITLRAQFPGILVGGVVALLLSFPIIQNIVANPDFGRPLTFDYREYLYQYYPYHMLIDSIPVKEWSIVILVIATAIIAGRILTVGRRSIQEQVFLTTFGFIIVLAVGIVLPYITSSRFLLNLHLLRSAVTLYLLAGIYTSILTASWLTSDDATENNVLGPSAVLFFCTKRGLLVFGLLLLIGCSVPAIRSRVSKSFGGALENIARRKVYVAALVSLIAAYWTYLIFSNTALALTKWEANAEWRSIARWGYSNTPPETIFLTPTYDEHPEIPDSQLPYDEEIRRHLVDIGVAFEFWSQRRIWIHFWHGAAVMWSPSYYEEWRRKITQVVRLRSVQEKLAYADANGINYVIDLCDDQYSEKPVFRTKRLCVYSAPRRLVD